MEIYFTPRKNNWMVGTIWIQVWILGAKVQSFHFCCWMPWGGFHFFQTNNGCNLFWTFFEIFFTIFPLFFQRKKLHAIKTNWRKVLKDAFQTDLNYYQLRSKGRRKTWKPRRLLKSPWVIKMYLNWIDGFQQLTLLVLGYLYLKVGHFCLFAKFAPRFKGHLPTLNCVVLTVNSYHCCIILMNL